MFSFLSNFFEKKQIDCFATLPLHACNITKPYLLERANIQSGTAVLIAIPYYSHAAEDPNRNISAYSVPRDYHRYFHQLFEELIPLLNDRFPEHRFAGFADHSPIDEIQAAARAGLGIIGKNNLLITQKYSSYIFLGELITDADIPYTDHGISHCENCGLCMRACPAHALGTCLSALTQKKGQFTESEKQAIRQYGSVWGCDICQEVCPHTKRAISSGTIFSPIAFFQQDVISHLNTEMIEHMEESAFTSRAFAWRGRETLLRNLKIFEKGEPSC
ncbi:MAG: epoxyqueuosine reductase [Clostridia bacterium]|nr:epoxyqueuosine reductase [Clostridia bacterium]